MRKIKSRVGLEKDEAISYSRPSATESTKKAKQQEVPVPCFFVMPLIPDNGSEGPFYRDYKMAAP